MPVAVIPSRAAASLPVRADCAVTVMAAASTAGPGRARLRDDDAQAVDYHNCCGRPRPQSLASDLSLRLAAAASLFLSHSLCLPSTSSSLRVPLPPTSSTLPLRKEARDIREQEGKQGLEGQIERFQLFIQVQVQSDSRPYFHSLHSSTLNRSPASRFTAIQLFASQPLAPPVPHKFSYHIASVGL